MAGLIKEVLILIVLVLMLMPFSYGLSVTCDPPSPLTVTVGASYTATVSHDGAVQVGFGPDPPGIIWQDGSFYNFEMKAPLSEKTKTYYGFAKDSSGSLIMDSTVKCIVTTSCSGTPNNNPSISITANPDSVSSGDSTSITVTGNDDEGLDFIQYSDGTTPSSPYSCDGETSCSNTWPGITITEETTFTGYAKDLCGETAEDTTTVTIVNNPPTFTTTQSDFDANPATIGQEYEIAIQASDADGDEITFTKQAGSGEIIGTSCTGDKPNTCTATYKLSSPTSVDTLNIRITDGFNVEEATFTITVLPPPECTTGETELCPKQNNICAGSQRQCINSMWSPASCNDVYDTIAGYEFPETNLHCDGIDNDCDGNVDEGCSCAEGQTKTEICGLGECKNTVTLTCSNGQWPGCVSDILPETEICDFLDNDCDGSVDEGGVCTCEKLLGLGVTGTAEIAHPTDGSNFITGNIISFLGEENKNVNAYSWEFGDGNTDPHKDSANIYSSPGDYSVKLRVIDDYSCENIKTITVHIASCQNNNDCYDEKTCQDGICKTEETTDSITEEALTITINSPTNQIYAQETVPLSFTTSQPADCSYSLNNGNFITIQPATNSVTGKEGANTLTVKCGETMAQRQFTVKLETEPTTVFDDLKGEEPDESLFDFMEEKGEEIKLTPQQAEEVILEVMEISGLEITKNREISGSKSLIMLNIRNLLPITLENTKLKVTIPKSVSETAEEIQSPQEFTIIENDPIIQFLLSLIKKEQKTIIMFEVNNIVDEQLLKEISAETEEDLTSLIQKQQETAKAAKITKEFEEFEKDGEKYTKITTKIKPKKGLKGMSLIEKIPKCLAKQIAFIEMDEKYRGMLKVINPDPLIMWHFEEITSEEYFEYEVKGVLSKDCKKQIASLGIADELGLDLEGSNILMIILPLLLIPIIGMTLIYFSKFAPAKVEKEEKQSPPEKLVQEKVETKTGEKDIGKEIDREIEETSKELEEDLEK